MLLRQRAETALRTAAGREASNTGNVSARPRRRGPVIAASSAAPDLIRHTIRATRSSRGPCSVPAGTARSSYPSRLAQAVLRTAPHRLHRRRSAIPAVLPRSSATRAGCRRAGWPQAVPRETTSRLRFLRADLARAKTRAPIFGSIAADGLSVGCRWGNLVEPAPPGASLQAEKQWDTTARANLDSQVILKSGYSGASGPRAR